MNLRKTLFALALGTVGITGAVSAHAFTLSNGDVLSINSGDFNYTSFTFGGSYFAMDLDDDSVIDNAEVILLSQGTTGLTIGALGGAGNTHVGTPVPADADSGEIVDSWSLGGATGTNYVVGTPITGGTNGLDMSGWTMGWAGLTSDIPLGVGSWSIHPHPLLTTNLPSSGYSNGIALFEWDGLYGHAYSLTYTATVPAGDPSSLGGIQYVVHLEGSVAAAIPEAETSAMMLAGLGLVGVSAARRKKQSKV